MKRKYPVIIQGSKFSDERGELSFNNDFDMAPVKRYYIIKHLDKSIIRAWQGHKIEHKYFKCINGSFVVAWKKIDDFSNPSDKNEPEFIKISKNDNIVLSIPPGYANGFKALEVNSEIIVFSDHYLSDAAKDNIRYDKNLWVDWSQF